MTSGKKRNFTSTGPSSKSSHRKRPKTEGYEVPIPDITPSSGSRCCSYCDERFTYNSSQGGARDNPHCLSCEIVTNALPSNSLHNARTQMKIAPLMMLRNGALWEADHKRMYGHVVSEEHFTLYLQMLTLHRHARIVTMYVLLTFQRTSALFPSSRGSLAAKSTTA
jgi:Pyruvate/2-oxoacid:ferredoxin oxidoreductase delta subunit